ncbi:MAG TPA: hypothetical protein VJ719_12285 [Chthoniobacterales bacterium]|nr:hypothetical protein [Chthoniobacterales bacterium]
MNSPVRCLHLFILTLAAILAFPCNAQTVTSTVAEMNGAATPGDGQNQLLTPSNPAELTVPAGWDFTSTNYQSLSQITFIQVTLTLQDGNSASGDFDFNHLFLSLDDINTGIALNGFRGNGLEDTLTISGNPGAAGPTILAALQNDGHLIGKIITDNVNDAIFPNELFVGNDALNAPTTLVVGVPEPATTALICGGLLLLLAPQVRRLRRNL